VPVKVNGLGLLQTHPGADFLDDSGFEREVAIERDVVVVGHGMFYFDVIPGWLEEPDPESRRG
jgi:hypothetical protein